MRRLANFALTAALALPALAACTAGPDYAPPALPAAPALAAGTFLRAADLPAQTPASRWWDGLDEPALTALIDRGLDNAPGVAAAAARLRQARSGLAAARAAALPSAGTSMLYARADLPADALGGSSGEIDLFNLGFDAQWEIDLWGGKRRNREKAAAEAQAAAAGLADVQVALSAEIARGYVSLRARQAGLALARRRGAIETRLAQLAHQRVAGGTAPRTLLEAALLQQARGEADQARLAADIAALTDSLAVLTGSAPGDPGDLPAGPVPLPPATVAVGDPAGLLRRRPDIAAAERRLAAATAQIGVTEARRFPQVSLMGVIGIGGTSAGDLLDTSRLSTIVLPRLSWNFLDFGRNRAARRGDEAARDAALAEYRGAVLAALQDAEGALVRYGAARTELAKAQDAAGHAGAIAALQEQRSRAGTIPASDSLEASRQATEAAMQEIASRAELTLAYIALAKVLGLGWQDAR